MNRLARVREAALKLGREKQIGLAVLGGLSFILVAVIAWRLSGGGRTENPEQNAAIGQADVAKKGPLMPAPDASRPTRVQQSDHEGIAHRSGGFTGHIEAAPPSDPINAVDPIGSARRREIAGDDRSSGLTPRVAERTKPTDDARPNPLRGRGQDELPDAASAIASDTGDADVMPPRRPLRRPVDDELEAPPRRSVYDRTERAAASNASDSPGASVSDSSDELPRGNLLRQRVATEPPVERKRIERQPMGEEELAPAAAPVQRKRPTELAETPPRRTAAVKRNIDDRPAPVRSASAVAPAAPAAATRTYLVHEGDTIYDIAQFELGRSARWVEIVALNRAALGDEIHFLKPGMKLVLPADSAADQVARQTGDDSVR